MPYVEAYQIVTHAHTWQCTKLSPSSSDGIEGQTYTLSGQLLRWKNNFPHVIKSETEIYYFTNHICCFFISCVCVTDQNLLGQESWDVLRFHLLDNGYVINILIIGTRLWLELCICCIGHLGRNYNLFECYSVLVIWSHRLLQSNPDLRRCISTMPRTPDWHWALHLLDQFLYFFHFFRDLLLSQYHHWHHLIDHLMSLQSNLDNNIPRYWVAYMQYID